MDATTDLLECSICTEPFGDARFLKCVHTFCVDCLQKMATSNPRYITCPTCRSKTYLSAAGVSDLPHNFYVDKMKEALHGKQADSYHKHEQELLDVTTLLTSCREENERLNVKIREKDKEVNSNLLRWELKKGRKRIEALEAEVVGKNKCVEVLLTEKEKHKQDSLKIKSAFNAKKIELHAQVSYCEDIKKQLEELQKEVADSKLQCQPCKRLKQELEKQYQKLSEIYKKMDESRELTRDIHNKKEECRALTRNIRQKIENIKEKTEECSKLTRNIHEKNVQCRVLEEMSKRSYTVPNVDFTQCKNCKFLNQYIKQLKCRDFNYEAKSYRDQLLCMGRVLIVLIFFNLCQFWAFIIRCSWG